MNAVGWPHRSVRVLLLAAVLASCSAPIPGDAETHGVVDAPVAPEPPRLAVRPVVHAPAEPVPTFSPDAVIRDTTALRLQATRYVGSPASKAPTIDKLSTLTLQAARAVERMRAHKTRKGYRPGDVTAARVAADALAALLQTEALSITELPSK